MLSAVQTKTADAFDQTATEQMAAAYATQAYDKNVYHARLFHLNTSDPLEMAASIVQQSVFLAADKDSVVSDPPDTRAYDLIVRGKSAWFRSRKIPRAHLLICLPVSFYVRSETLGDDACAVMKAEIVRLLRRKFGNGCDIQVKIQPDANLDLESEALIYVGQGIHLSDAPLNFRLELSFRTASGALDRIEPTWHPDQDQDTGSPFGVRSGQSILVIGGTASKAPLRMAQWPWPSSHLMINVSNTGRPVVFGDGNVLSAQLVRFGRDESGAFVGFVSRRPDPQRPAPGQPEGVLVRMIPVTPDPVGNTPKPPSGAGRLNKPVGSSGGWRVGSFIKRLFGRLFRSSTVSRRPLASSPNIRQVIQAAKAAGDGPRRQEPHMGAAGVFAGHKAPPRHMPAATGAYPTEVAATQDAFSDDGAAEPLVPVDAGVEMAPPVQKNLRIVAMLLPFLPAKIGGPEGCSIDMAALTGNPDAPVVGVLANSRGLCVRNAAGGWDLQSLPVTYGDWTIEAPPPALAQDYVALLRPPAGWTSPADQNLHEGVPVLFGRQYEGAHPQMFAAGLLGAPTAILWLPNGKAHLDSWRHNRRHLVLSVREAVTTLEVSLATDESKPALLLGANMELIGTLSQDNRTGQIAQGQYILAGVYLLAFG